MPRIPERVTGPGGSAGQPRSPRRRLSQAIDVQTRYAQAIDEISERSISVVVPVKDNAAGVARLLDALLDPAAKAQPREIIVVDNNSAVPLHIADRHRDGDIPVRLLTCARPGAAAARNVGAAAAEGDWLLFTDSDCIPTPSFVAGYLSTSGRAIAYTGSVTGIPQSRLTRFYDTEGVLLPRLAVNSAGETVPLFAVTANALVWKRAFDTSGGFCEEFDSAGGEDVELSLRLWQIGGMECAFDSVVRHDFSDGMVGLWRRFARYGRGIRRLEPMADLVLTPRWHLPVRRDVYGVWARLVEHAALCYGYYGVGRRPRSGAR